MDWSGNNISNFIFFYKDAFCLAEWQKLILGELIKIRELDLTTFVVPYLIHKLVTGLDKIGSKEHDKSKKKLSLTELQDNFLSTLQL
jgi:hypothetical protein